MNKITIAFLFAALSIHTLAHADTRYETYCVVSNSDPQTILVYDDLENTYASKKGKNSAALPVKDVRVYKLLKGVIPNTPNLHETLTSLRLGHPKKVTGFQDFMDENAEAMQMTSYSSKNATFTFEKTAVGQLVTIEGLGQKLFSVPYVETNEEGKMPTAEITGAGLIFNGQATSGLRYYDCGQEAD